MGKRVILVPLDPVHDIGLKMIGRALSERGHETRLLQPDLSCEEIVGEISRYRCDYALVGRTLGYGVEEMLARLADLADAAGLRPKVKMVVGGMAIKPELAAELGYDAGFGPNTPVEEVVAYVEGRPYDPRGGVPPRSKPSLTRGYTYRFRNSEVEALLSGIVEEVVCWASGVTSPGVERARIRSRMFESRREGEGEEGLAREYERLCEPVVAESCRGAGVPKARAVTPSEKERLERRLLGRTKGETQLRHGRDKPLVFVQYGTGCPLMDVAHVEVAESWGADGVVHFDPSWAARREGLFRGLLAHEEDGSLITEENLRLVKSGLGDPTLWQVRAHRGLNTAETVVLAGECGADLTKINIAYGSLGGGTDPERLAADGVEAMRQAARYGMPFDVVTNEELCGVPAHKAFAGMLITAAVGIRLGGLPVLQPLFCRSPQVMLEGFMADNYVDFNAAKVLALRQILDAPIWPGAPIGFLTHTPDRVQASVTTALHACLASSLGVDAISISSADEAYSGGPISAASRVDTLRAVREGLRFFGRAGIEPTDRARLWASDIVEGIVSVLRDVARGGSFVGALYEGLLGSREEGAYPGRVGRGTVKKVRAG
ncbi:MAG: cobalamin B12-binding domain-containing protein [Firmicutes bacterium]|jgi:methylmalonyl-CoA mutase cobalamin-binding subunit|nr:cobalamin B12-binding domain-containing protein [Bacillota bacterium]